MLHTFPAELYGGPLDGHRRVMPGDEYNAPPRQFVAYSNPGVDFSKPVTSIDYRPPRLLEYRHHGQANADGRLVYVFAGYERPLPKAGGNG